MKKLCFILIFALAFLGSCSELELKVDVPNCIEKKIRNLKQYGVQNPPAKVWQWKVDGKTYYYITSDCCDQYHYLYDDDCNIVCAPYGGITGTGDGKCPEFKGEIEKTLVWEDTRKQ